MLNFYKKYKKIIKTTIFVIGLLFLISLAYSYKEQIVRYVLVAELKLLTFSIMIGVLSNVLMAYYFAHLLLKHGLDTSIKKGINVYMHGQIAKYVPGKIWGMIYQVSNFDSKMGPTAIVLANVELMINALFIMTVIACLTYILPISISLFILCLLIGFGIFHIAYNINFLKKLATFFAKYIRFLSLPDAEMVYKTSSIFPFIFYFSFVVSYVLSTGLMLHSVFGVPINDTLIIICISTFAWVVSVFIFIVPAGIGVREVIFLSGAYALMPDMSVEITASIAIFTRVLQVLQELLGVAIAQLLFKVDSRQ